MGAGQSKTPPSSQPSLESPSGETALSSAVANHASASTPIDDASPSPPSQRESADGGGGGGGGCPMKNADGSYRVMPGFASLFGRKGHPPVDSAKLGRIDPATSVVDDDASSSSPSAGGGGGGCPVKKDDPSSSRSWNILRRGGSGPGSDNLAHDGESACPVQKDSNSSSSSSAARQQYDVYSRPLPMDPTNNMPLANPAAIARNSLPSPGQNAALPTERVSSTIPKGGAADGSGTTWTYPSPQMFYNALARKGKLGDDACEEDMVSVVAIHNCMNEGTWERILQWERALRPVTSKEEGGGEAAGPSLTKFMGRPSDLSPKAFFKHHVLGHPLPFDRHDWTVTRTNADGSTEDVRYVIDYYHDDAAAEEGEGSGFPAMNDGIGQGPEDGDGGGKRLRSLLVDVRPAADDPSSAWGRMVTMPLARRGCRSMLECLLFKGSGSGPRSDFEPLPLRPTEALKDSVGESRRVWDDIQRDAAERKGVGAKDEACASDESSAASGGKEGKGGATGGPAAIHSPPADSEIKTTRAEAATIAASYSEILSSCRERKAALQTCSSDEECRRAFMGMTVCAGQFMCPLQHSGLVNALEGSKGEDPELDAARMDAALDVLGECVAGFDRRAGAARLKFPEVFEEVLGTKGA